MILKDADENTPGTSEVVINWTSRGIEIHPSGTGTKTADAAPIFIERYKGHCRVVVWSDIDEEDPTHVVSLVRARLNMRGQPEEIKEIIKKSLPATYTSVWDNGTKITTVCLYNPEKQECFDIEVCDDDPGDANLVDEYVTLGDLQLRAQDGVTFAY